MPISDWDKYFFGETNSFGLTRDANLVVCLFRYADQKKKNVSTYGTPILLSVILFIFYCGDNKAGTLLS